MLLQVPQPAQPEQPCSGPLSTKCFDSEKACVCSPPSPHSQLEDYFIYESQEITQTSSRTKGKLAWTDDRNLAVHQESSNATRIRLLRVPMHSLCSCFLLSFCPIVFLINTVARGCQYLPNHKACNPPGKTDHPISVICQIITGSFHLVGPDSIAQLALAGCTW